MDRVERNLQAIADESRARYNKPRPPRPWFVLASLAWHLGAQVTFIWLLAERFGGLWAVLYASVLAVQLGVGAAKTNA